VKHAVAVAALVALAACATRSAWKLPQPVIPHDNPQSVAKVELGRRLFYDADLSIDGVMSCATCHEQKHGFTDTNKTHPGVRGQPALRNVQTLVNLGLMSPLTFADPRNTTLEVQAHVPITGTDPVEMGMKPDLLPARLKDQACYPKLFAAAFPERQGELSMDTIVMALAAFERTLVSDDAPYDRYRRGQGELGATEKTGEALFAKGCASCHAGANFTDLKFHRISSAPVEARDTGLSRVTGKAEDDGRFRTQTLRNVGVTGPYLHDGSAPTLFAAIKAHDVAAKLSAEDVGAIEAFLGSLTDRTFLTNPAYALPPPGCPELPAPANLHNSVRPNVG
jgi:cytochrome c peroxidase